jgi:hypothetical protein
MMMPFTSFTSPPLLILVVQNLFLVLVLVYNKTLPDSTRLVLVFVRLFRAIRRMGVIGFIFLCIHNHIVLSFSIFELRRRRRHGEAVKLKVRKGWVQAQGTKSSQ